MGGIKAGAFAIGEAVGLTRAIGRSSWRTQRLLVLCYHGVSQRDEHEWSPELYISPTFLRRRLTILAEEHANVMSLDEGAAALRAGTLPPRAVVITFDDGNFDFHSRALPLLAERNYPATNYASTYYASYQRPVFGPSTSYLLWRGRGQTLPSWREVGLEAAASLRSEAGRAVVLATLRSHAERSALTAEEKDSLNAQLAGRLSLDYDELLRDRLFHLMTGPEMRDVVAAGHAMELHTHRHRTPRDEQLFRREIRDNRNWLTQNVGATARHFCYPSGVHRPEFLPWLEAEGIETATTCVPGLGTPGDPQLLLPRFIDTMRQSEGAFRAWVNGLAHLARRPRWSFSATPD